MGSPLGPILADIFMATLENKSQDKIKELLYYGRYVDDTFVVCQDANHAQQFLCHLNSLHPNIHFTCESEHDDRLAFLDVVITRDAAGCITRSVNHKSATLQRYLHFRSFAPASYKRTLVRTLFTRAYRICSSCSFEAEAEHIRASLKRSGYPDAFIKKYSSPAPTRVPTTSVPKKKVYIRLDFKGDDVTSRITRRLQGAIQRTFPAAELLVLSKTTRIPLPNVKDSLPYSAKSNCIYQYECTCGSTYVGRTVRQLSIRISEHLPRWFLNSENRQPKSSITKHLMDSTACLGSADRFRVINCQPTFSLLRWAEAVAIRHLKPALCVQKDRLLCLTLPW